MRINGNTNAMYLPRQKQPAQKPPIHNVTAPQGSEAVLLIRTDLTVKGSAFSRLANVANRGAPPSVETALNCMEEQAYWMFDDLVPELPRWGIDYEKMLDGYAAEYGIRKNSLDEYYSDEAINARMDEIGILNAEDRKTIFDAQKKAYTARSLRMEEIFTSRAMSRIDDMIGFESYIFSFDEEPENRFYISSGRNGFLMGINPEDFRAAMVAVWGEKVEISQKLAKSVGKDGLANAITQYSLDHSAVKFDVEGVQFTYKDMMVYDQIMRARFKTQVIDYETFEKVELMASAATFMAKSLMTEAAAQKFIQRYETDIYARDIESAEIHERGMLELLAREELSKLEIQKWLQEKRQLAKMFRNMEMDSGNAFKSSFSKIINALSLFNKRNGILSDTSSLVNIWNTCMEGAKRFGMKEEYSLNTTVDIRV